MKKFLEEERYDISEYGDFEECSVSFLVLCSFHICIEWWLWLQRRQTVHLPKNQQSGWLGSTWHSGRWYWRFFRYGRLSFNFSALVKVLSTFCCISFMNHNYFCLDRIKLDVLPKLLQRRQIRRVVHGQNWRQKTSYQGGNFQGCQWRYPWGLQ